MHEAVKKAADKGDRERIKFTFVDALDADPTFEKYQEDFDYCRERGLFDTHLELNRLRLENLDETYWFALKKDFQKNASIERLDHMRKVAKVLFADKIDRLVKEREEERKDILQQSQINAALSPATPISPGTEADSLNLGKTNREEKNNQSKVSYAFSKENEISPSEQQKMEIEEAKRKLKEEEERKERERSSCQSQKPYGSKKNCTGKKARGMGLPLLAAIVTLAVIVLIVLR